MAYVVTPACHKCKYTDCVVVCPVDCFYELDSMLVIHPDDCIDCGACEPECPTTAIFEEADLPDKWSGMIEFNAKMSGADHSPGADYVNAGAPFPNTWDQKDPLPGADAAADMDKTTSEVKAYYNVS